MNHPDFEQTLHLAEEIRRLAASLLAHPEEAVPAKLNGTLFQFSETTREIHAFEPAREMARSLGALLADCNEQVLDSQTRLQALSILQNLLEELDVDGSVRHSKSRTPLVTPISPSTLHMNNRVVLYIDNNDLLVMLREVLFQAGFTTTNIASLDDLTRISEEDYPAAIIADLSLCHLSPDFGEVFAQFRQRGNPPPHLFCIAGSKDIPARLEAVRLGATRFFSKPLDVTRLVAVLKGVTGQTPTSPFKALLIDDDQLAGEIYEASLRHAGVETMIVRNPLQAPYLISQFKPDVIVTDVYMPGCNGLELLAVLRQDDMLADTPVIFLSSDNDIRCRLEALDLGGDDFLTKPIDTVLFVATVITRAKRSRVLKRSRSEYRNILDRMREMESHLPGNIPALRESTFQPDVFSTDLTLSEEYVIDDTGNEDAAQKSTGFLPGGS
jgi:DNA-binding response OmpR family regulator